MKLDPRHVSSAPNLARQFQSAQPFRFLAVDNFLDPNDCNRLLEEFPAFEAKWAVNEMGIAGRKSAIPNIRQISPAYRDFDQLMQSPTFLAFMGKLTGIDNLLYDPDYVGGGTHENLHGQDLDVHVDFNFHPKKLWHRRLNLIVFLNPQWEAEWGGCLELQKDPWNPNANETVSVVPILNRAVLFETTESSWHGFKKINLSNQSLSRKSLAVYFYTKDRPAEETEAAHGTVYAPQPLPDHLQPGHTLSQEDTDTLHILVERRNSQIRFLYERELEFARTMREITESPSFQLGRVLTWPARFLRDKLR